MRLRNKFLLVMITFLTLVSAGFSFLLYERQQQTDLQAIRQELWMAARMANEALPQGYHDQITGPDSIAGADFEQVSDHFSRLCSEADLAHLWSLMILNGHVVYSAAGSSGSETGQPGPDVFFQARSDPALYSTVFQTMNPQFQTGEDLGGSFYTILVPYRDSQGRPYLIGASRSTAAVDVNLRETLILSSLMAFVFIIGGILISLGLADTLIRPLESFSKAAASIASGDFSFRVEPQGSSELDELASSINSMSLAVQSRLEDLSASRENLRITLASIGDAVITTDHNGIITRTNPAADALSGWPEAEVIGKPFDEVFHFIHPGTRLPLPNPVRTAMTEKRVVNLSKHTLLVDRSGREHRITDSAAPILDRSDQVVGSVMVFQDITEQERRDRALRMTTEELENFFALTPGPLCITDSSGYFRLVNPAWTVLLGYTPNELLGHSMIEFIHPDDVASTVLALQSVSHGQPAANFANRCLTKKGKYQWLEWNVQSSRDRIYCAAHDITGTMLAQKALQQNAEQFSAITSTSIDGFVVIDLQGTLIETNEAYCRMTGYTREEIIGQNIADLGFLETPERIAEVFSSIKEMGYQRFETRQHRKDGQVIDLEISVTNVQGRERIIAFLQDITERRQSEIRSRRRLEQLTNLRMIDQSISLGDDLMVTLNLILRKAVYHTGAEGAAILQLSSAPNDMEAPDHLVVSAQIGTRTPRPRPIHRPKIEGTAWEVVENRQPMICTVQDPATPNYFAEFMARENFSNCLRIPLLIEGRITGILETYHRSAIPDDKEWFNYLESLAGQAAIAIRNAHLLARLHQTNEELAASYTATIGGFSRALEIRDKESFGHSERVTDLTLRLARRMGMPESDIQSLYHGVLLHDIGKIGIPDSILLKPGPLDAAEWEIMRQHPTLAWNLLKNIPFLRGSIDIPYCHHERWDGTGYPRGLKGEEIPLAARIFSVIDVYDALITERPYRKAWTKEETIAYLCYHKGKIFDPQVVNTFITMDL